jgi:hypothetical protein
MARSGWHISISLAHGTRPEEVDSSRIEEVDSFWIVDGDLKDWDKQGAYYGEAEMGHLGKSGRRDEAKRGGSFND